MSRYTVEDAAAVLSMTTGAVRNPCLGGLYGALKSTGRYASYYLQTQREMPPGIPATY